MQGALAVDISLKREYTERYHNLLVPMVPRLEEDLRRALNGIERIDRIYARAKEVKSFLLKATKVEDGQLKYNDPLNEIQDQIGARVIVFFLRDVEVVGGKVIQYYRPIEERQVIPETESEFGYFGKHYVLKIPNEIRGSSPSPTFFELQIKTLFQHSWAEANHDLGYKARQELEKIHKRKLAFTAAQAWGADQIFDELYGELGP